MARTGGTATTNRRRWLVTVGVLVAAVAGFSAVYLLFFTPETKERASLSKAGEKGSVDDPSGTWEIVQGDNTYAGYRVREKLARLPAPSDAVGRTPAVTGTIKVERAAEGFAISGIDIEADVSQLRSDEARRDSKIRTLGLETERFPTATFVSTEPVEVPAAVLDGRQIDTEVTGDLTIHDVTKEVTIPLEGQVVGDEIEVVGSLTFPMADFDIDPPNVGGFVSVEDQGTLEFKLRLARSA
jgi:polyisoprenoid-binding protein YceI